MNRSFENCYYYVKNTLIIELHKMIEELSRFSYGFEIILKKFILPSLLINSIKNKKQQKE